MYKLPDGPYCAYLRKSRADLEAETRGEEDTYARHERILLDLAKRHGILITHIYREQPITGERISARPEMMKLLADVEEGRWTGVLVVEVERLARGDTMDQGIVAQAFKYSNTLIVTPMRVYDPSNPDDEEYFEFGLFMSRREFKTITRRLQSGRVASVKEGKYVGNKPPYGYVRVKYPHGKGYTLEPHPEQAPVVKLIFSLYTDPDPKKRMGTGLIARHLNEVLKIPSATGGKWTVATLNGLFRNPIYAGYVRWGSRPQLKRRDGRSRPRKPEDQWVLVKGLHPPLVDEETFRRAQEILRANSHPPAPAGKISNPLAGLIRCDMCGSSMVLRPYSGKNTPPTIICQTQGCRNVSSYFHLVEERLLQSLREWLSSYKAQWEQRRPKNQEGDEAKLQAHENVVKSLRRKLEETLAQRNELHDLLERRIYTVEIFLERSQVLAQRIEETKAALAIAEQELELERKRMEARAETIPKVEHVLEVYHQTDDPAKKNALLKSVLEYAVYRKEKGGRWSGAEDQFSLTLFPKLPK
ncbi:MAG: recombinase family protein [Alicyclobacillaceae bacterium]|nr:recombinase family protein [Alicyclobacillaceae bacterium]